MNIYILICIYIYEYVGIESEKEDDSPRADSPKRSLLEKYQAGLTTNRSERLSLDPSGKKDTELGVKKLVGRWGDAVKENSYKKNENSIVVGRLNK
jgi:hypothetical protein